ncbi:MAG: hypothetical protein KAR20_17200 [Candidatus Heimdallarchaeota archaeon]|nr:hypothetical protein [Candidatus Heimdallarchaeota archaeon]
MKTQKMSKKLLKSRKGVSGAISGVFVILICFMALAALFTYAVSIDRYNQVVNERNRMEWEIQNEKFTITEAQRNYDGTLNVTIFNFGGMTAHLVDIWITMKNGTSNESLHELYRINYYINPTEQLSEIGSQNATQLPSGEVQSINLKEPVVANINYTIKIVSERGNTASYLIEYDESEGPPIAFSYGSMEINWVDPNSEPDWHPAFISKDSLDTHVRENGDLYFRAKFTNMWNKQLNISDGSILFQICTAPDNKKIFGFGGLKYSGPQIWDPDVEVTIVYTADTCTWSNAMELEDLFPGTKTEVPFSGSAAFTSSVPPSEDDYFSASLLMDGLLVYKE